MLLFVLGKVYNIAIHPTTTLQTHTVREKKTKSDIEATSKPFPVNTVALESQICTIFL